MNVISLLTPKAQVAYLYQDFTVRQGLEKLDVRLTYYQIDTDDILRFVRHFTLEELEAFLQDLLEQYAPWAQRQLAWKEQRGVSLSALDFPFP